MYMRIVRCSSGSLGPPELKGAGTGKASSKSRGNWENARGCRAVNLDTLESKVDDTVESGVRKDWC